MIILDEPKLLLFIEPSKSEKLEKPIDDYLVQFLENAIENAPTGCYFSGGFRTGVATKGFHRTECGERSSNVDYLLENGMVTNKLGPFYLKWYRYSIPETEMKKVEEAYNYYKDNNLL